MEKSRLRTKVYELPVPSTEEDYKKCLPLPEWRQRQAESFSVPTDRLQCAKAYMLLRSMLEEDLGKPVTPPRFAYGKYGKPSLTDYPQLHFNLSHCAKAVICTLGNIPVGCDVEEIPTSLPLDLLDLCFSTEEREQIKAADSPTLEFTRQWTRKEALLKLLGIGLTDDLPLLMTSPPARKAHFETITCTESGYVYTICHIPTDIH